jgi:hypothetical protein
MAFKALTRTEIPVTVVDIVSIARGEFAENTERKDFTWSEAVEIKRALEPLEKAAAKERQGERTDKLVGKLPTGSKRKPPKRARDKVAKATGMSARTLAKAEAVVAAAEHDPENYGTCERQAPTSPRLGTRVGRPVYPGRVTHILLVPPARP